MLEQLRSWVKARVGSTGRQTPQQTRDSAQLKRETRAHTVTDLQTEVRHLQQQITDLTAGDGSGGPEADRQELARLEEELAKTQAELARYQGRI